MGRAAQVIRTSPTSSDKEQLATPLPDPQDRTHRPEQDLALPILHTHTHILQQSGSHKKMLHHHSYITSDAEFRSQMGDFFTAWDMLVSHSSTLVTV